MEQENCRIYDRSPLKSSATVVLANRVVQLLGRTSEDSGSEVQLKPYDVMGREVRTIQAPAEEERHKRRLDVPNLASGIYFLRLQARGQAETRKVAVVR